MPSRRTALEALLLALAIAAAYANTIGNGFHLDDGYGLVENPWIRGLGNIPRFFVDPFTLTTYRYNADWRPLLQASYALNYAVSGYETWSWHALNLALHWVVALGVLALGRLLLGSGRPFPLGGLSEAAGDRAALAAALLFAVHPIGSGAVNYLWARSSLLVAALAVPACALYVGSLTGRCAWWTRWLALGLFALALLTKAEAVSVVGAVAAAELCFAPESPESPKSTGSRAARGPLLARLWNLASWKRAAPFALLAAAYLGVRWAILPAWLRAYHAEGPADSLDYLLTQLRVWWRYAATVVAPLFLVADWGPGGYSISRSLAEPRVWLAAAGWACVLALALARVRSAPAVAFLVLWFPLHLMPHSSFVPLAEMLNEHRPYLASIALFLLGAAGAAAVATRAAGAARGAGDGRAGRAAFAIGTLVLALAYGGLTRERNQVWRDELSLWTDTVAKVPGSTRAQMNLGRELRARGRRDEAERCFVEAVRLAPNYDLARINLALSLEQRGDVPGAEREYAEAIRLEPARAQGYLWRGRARLARGSIVEAESDLRAALTIEPENADALAALAGALAAAGRTDETQAILDRGLAIDRPRFEALAAQLLAPGG